MIWDFGDGAGFSDTSANPIHIYTDKGTYLVRLATEDINGCKDTVYKTIEVTGVNADIWHKDSIYLF